MIASDADILALPIRDKRYKHFLGNGLYVFVWPNGQKYWRLKYRFDSRENTYSIGVFPEVSAEMALKATKYVRGLIYEGVDPMAAKKEAVKLKQTPIPKSLFRLALSSEGGLTIETDSGQMALTSSQTIAIRGFLNAN